MKTEFQATSVPLRIDDTGLTVSAIQRDGPRAPIVFLHGFGSTKVVFDNKNSHSGTLTRMRKKRDCTRCRG